MSKITMSQVAINNMTYRRCSFDSFLNSAQQLGVKKIELSGCHPHFTIFEAAEFNTKELAKKIKDHGISVSAIEPEQNFLPINIAALDSYLREQSIKQLAFFIERAGVFDCDKVIIYPGKAFMNYPHSEAWKYSRDSIGKLCEIAKTYGVTILLEGVSNFISDLMMDSATVKRMMDEVNADNIGCCVNSSAAYAAHETLEEYFKLFGNKIGIVQLSDSVEDNEQLPWSSEGLQDLNEHINTLRKYNYSGDIAMELLAEEFAGDPEASYMASIDYFKKYLDKEARN